MGNEGEEKLGKVEGVSGVLTLEHFFFFGQVFEFATNNKCLNLRPIFWSQSESQKLVTKSVANLLICD